MELNFLQFYKSTNVMPNLLTSPASKNAKYYVDLSKFIGDEVNKIYEKTTKLSSNEPTCTGLTSYIGSGKSTELLRLKRKLEVAGFHVVYLQAHEDLNMLPVFIVDIWLAIACRIVQSFEIIEIKTPEIKTPEKLNKFARESLQSLDFDVQGKIKQTISESDRVNPGQAKDIFTWSLEMREVMKTSLKKSSVRKILHRLWDSQKSQLIEALNQELIEPLINQIKSQGKQGLVVIMDGLDRINNIRLPGGQVQQEYLFIDQGEYLTKLNCHIIYTVPISLLLSNHYEILTQHFGELRILPMVPVRSRDGSEHPEGMARLRQLVLIRAFPELNEQQRLEAIPLVFENAEALDRLCQISGGHIRNLRGLLYGWVREHDELCLPLKRQALEQVISSYKKDLIAAIGEQEWELLQQVKFSKRLNKQDPKYQMLLRAMFVFEYREGDEVWFDINPALNEAEELQKLANLILL